MIPGLGAWVAVKRASGNAKGFGFSHDSREGCPTNTAKTCPKARLFRKAEYHQQGIILEPLQCRGLSGQAAVMG